MGTEIEIIKKSIIGSMKKFSEHQIYSNNPGIYAFALKENSRLKDFGLDGKIIYVGKAEDSLKKRDLNTHFKNGRTGNSTLRRSIGAILKEDFNAIAFSRNRTLMQPNIDNYKFDSKSESILTQWMIENLVFGFWEYYPNKENKILRDIEEDMLKSLKPCLDLDNRTKKYNIHASSLTTYRERCKFEARQNVINGVSYF